MALMSAVNLTQAAKDDGHIVVMISVDGMASYYLDDPKADIPTMRALMAEGASRQNHAPGPAHLYLGQSHQSCHRRLSGEARCHRQ